MPFVNYFAARQTDPDQYKDFRYQKVDGAAGLYFVFGLKKDDGDVKAEVQSIRADKDTWNLKDFKAWLKRHDFKTDKIEKPVEKSIDLFSVFTSFDIEKSDDSEVQEVKIGGIISSDAKDQQGDVLLQDGMDWSYFLKRGYFNYEHQQGPENILGVPSKVESVLVNGVKATRVEGVLLLKTPKAKSVYESIKALNSSSTGRQIGFSVEGQVLERDKLNPQIIKRAKILNVSITAHPVNADTRLELLARSLMKNDASNELQSMLSALPESTILELINMLTKLVKEREEAEEEAGEEPEMDTEEKGEVGYQTPAETSTGDISALVPQSIEGKPASEEDEDEKMARFKMLLMEALKSMESGSDIEEDDDEDKPDMPMTADQMKVLSDVAKEVTDILAELGEDYDLPEWIQSKITLALDYLHSSKHYLALRLEDKKASSEEKEEEALEINNNNSYVEEVTSKVKAAFSYMSDEDSKKVALAMIELYSK